MAKKLKKGEQPHTPVDPDDATDASVVEKADVVDETTSHDDASPSNNEITEEQTPTKRDDPENITMRSVRRDSDDNETASSPTPGHGAIAMRTQQLGVQVDVIDPRFAGDTTPRVEYALTTQDYDSVIASEANPTHIVEVNYNESRAKQLADVVETYCTNTTLRYVDLKRFRQLANDEVEIVHTAISNLQGSPLAASNDTMLYQLWADRSHQLNKQGLLDVDSDSWSNAQARLAIDDFVYDVDAPYTGKDLIVRSQLISLCMVGAALCKLTESDLSHPWLFDDDKYLDVQRADLTLVTAKTTPSRLLNAEILPVDIPTDTKLVFDWNDDTHAPVAKETIASLNSYVRKLQSQFNIKNGRVVADTKGTHTSAVAVVKKMASTYAQKILHAIIRPSVYDGRNYLMINRLLAKSVFTMISSVCATTSYVDNLDAFITDVDKSVKPTSYHSGVLSALLKINSYVLAEDIDLATPGKVVVKNGWDVEKKTFAQKLHITHSAQPAVAKDNLGDPQLLSYEYDVICQAEFFANASAYHAQRFVYYRTRRDAERDIELVSRAAIAALVSDDALTLTLVRAEISKVDALYTSAVMFFRTLEDADLKGLTSMEIQRIEQLTKSTKLVETLPNFDSLHSLSAKTFARTSSLHVDTTTDLLKLSQSNADRLHTKHMEAISLRDVYNYVPDAVSELASSMGASYIKMVGTDAIADGVKQVEPVFMNAIDSLQTILKYVSNARMDDVYRALANVVHFDMDKLYYQLYTIIATDDNACDALANGTYSGALTVSSRAGDITVMRRLRPLAAAVGMLADIKLALIHAAIHEILQTTLYLLMVHATHVYIARQESFDRTKFLWSDRLYQAIIRDIQYPIDLERALTFVRELAAELGYSLSDITNAEVDWHSLEALGMTAYNSSATLTSIPYIFRNLEDTSDPYGYVRARASVTALIDAASSSTVVDALRSGAWHSMLTQLDLAHRSAEVSSVIRLISPKPTSLVEKALAFDTFIKSLPDTQSLLDDAVTSQNAMSDGINANEYGSALPKMYVLSSLEKKLVELRKGDAFDALSALLGDTAYLKGTSHHQRALAFSTRFVDAVGALTNWFRQHSARITPIKKAFFSTMRIDDMSAMRFDEHDNPVDRLIKHKLLSASGLYSQQKFVSLPLVTTSALDDLTLLHLAKRVMRCQLAYALLDDLSNTHLVRVAARAGSSAVVAYDVLRSLNCDPEYRLRISEARTFLSQLRIVNQRLRAMNAMIVAGGGATKRISLLFEGQALPAGLADTDMVSLADILQLADPAGSAYVDVYTNSLVEGLYAFTLIKKHHQAFILTGERSARIGVYTNPIKMDAALYGDYYSLPESELPYGTVEKLLLSILNINA